MKPGFLFSTGSARGGTGLVSRMLSVSPKVEIALDPYLSLFKLFRNSITRETCDAEAPLHDYYFSKEGTALLEEIQNASLDLNWDQSRRGPLIAALKKRARLSSGDLVSWIDRLDGTNFRELFESGIGLIEKARKKEGLSWIGLHENWAVEFFPSFARAFPKAKFMIVLRDPRAVLNSNFNVKEISLKGHALSYSKALRKLMAHAFYYQTLPLFKERLFVLRYEDLILEPEAVCKKMCDFLGINFQQEMLDTNRYVEPSTGEVYNGFSSFETRVEGFSPHRIDRWKQHLDQGLADLVDFICGPEMSLFHYKTSRIDLSVLESQEVLKTLMKDGEGEKSWRTDFGSPLEDYGFEMFRRILLRDPTIKWDPFLIRRNFLFTEVYEGLKKCS